MSGLAAFIGARLDEDQALAQAALKSVLGIEGELADAAGPCIGDAGYLYIKRHDPARVLRDIAADRALLAAITKADSESTDVDMIYIDYWIAQGLLRHLASRWPDHADYAAAVAS